MKSSRRIFIKQGAFATIAAFGAGPLLWTNMGCALAQEDPSKLSSPVPNLGDGKFAEVNQVPYIANYYLKPKVSVGEKIVINYYVTDFQHKEYRQDDHSETFTVEYWVNGAKTTLKGIKAGDNSVTLKPIPRGKVLFALQVTDKTGRKSHKLFQEFQVVEPTESDIPKGKVLTPDLKKFQIFNDDTHPVETTAGLTAMLKWASDNGYRKVLLPQGRYRLDENSTVQMATNLTLDMGGSTFKLNPSQLDQTMMFEIVNCIDSHVINGTFEGDLKERDTKVPGYNGEWVNAISMGQGTQYSSYKDITIVDVTGYGSNTGIGGAGTRQYSLDPPLQIGAFLPGEIDMTGQLVPSDVRTTTEKFTDVSKFAQSLGFVQMGMYLGYQGNPANTWAYKASFYDADKKFIEAIDGYMYRRLYMPRNAHFAKFTLYSTATPERLYVFNFRPPYNCAFINVHHKNIRCVGMVPSGFNNLLVEGNTFENCGWSKARCAFDAEDGWDLMQDLTFRKNIFGNNPGAEFVTVCGHNFLVEDNTMGAVINRRTNSYVFRNNTVKSASLAFGARWQTGSPRVFNNTFTNGVRLVSDTPMGLPDWEFCIRDNVYLNGVVAILTKGVEKLNIFIYKSKITAGDLSGKFVDCVIKGIKKPGQTVEIYGSVIDNCELKTSGLNLQSKIVNSTITNSHLLTQGGTITLENNVLNETEATSSDGWLTGNEYILINNKVNTSFDHLVLIGNSYKQVILDGNTITSTNPNFSAVLLNNPVKENLIDQRVSIVGNTFHAKGGTVLNIPRMPNPACMLTVSFVDNIYDGIEEISKKALAAPNVKIVRAKPA